MRKVILSIVLFVAISGAGPAVEFALDLTYDDEVSALFPEFGDVYSSGDPFLPPDVRILPLKATKDAADKSIEIIRDSGFDDLVCVVAFATNVDWVVPLTYDYESVRRKIRGINRSSVFNTNIHLGIRSARLELLSERGRARSDKVLVLMTDGNSDAASALAEAELAADAGVTIHTVGLGSDVDHDLLNEIAAMNGGQAIYIDNDTGPEVYGPQLETVFQNLASDVGLMLID